MKTYDIAIRVSNVGDRDRNSESYMTEGDQLEKALREIARVGGRKGRVFELPDQSGFTVAKSEAYAAIIERVRRGHSHGAAFGYFDRSGRNWWGMGAFYEGMNEVDGAILYPDLPDIDYRTPQGRQMTGMHAIASELPYHSAKGKSEATVNTMLEHAVPNRVPYGYRRNEVNGVKVEPERAAKSLVPDEDRTAPTVRRIFAMRGDGIAPGDIVATLNDAGVPAPRGGRWTLSTIGSLIKNEAYMGTFVYGRGTARKPGTLRRVEGAWTALVTPAQWRAAQGTRPVTRNGRMVTGLAGAVLQCSGCGGSMRVSSSGDGRLFYACRRSSSTGVCPAPTNVSKDAADAFVDDLIVSDIEGDRFKVLTSARETEQARLAHVAASEYRKAWHRTQGTIDDGEWGEEYELRKQAEAEALAAYEAALAHSADIDDLPMTVDAWRALDLAHQRRVASAVIDAVIVKPPLSRSKFADIRERFRVVPRGG